MIKILTLKNGATIIGNVEEHVIKLTITDSLVFMKEESNEVKMYPFPVFSDITKETTIYIDNVVTVSNPTQYVLDAYTNSIEDIINQSQVTENGNMETT